jgi:hypothetical protein
MGEIEDDPVDLQKKFPRAGFSTKFFGDSYFASGQFTGMRSRPSYEVERAKIGDGLQQLNRKGFLIFDIGDSLYCLMVVSIHDIPQMDRDYSILLSCQFFDVFPVIVPAV